MRDSKASRTETIVFINGERYIQITVKDYYGNVVFSSLVKQ